MIKRLTALILAIVLVTGTSMTALATEATPPVQVATVVPNSLQASQSSVTLKPGESTTVSITYQLSDGSRKPLDPAYTTEHSVVLNTPENSEHLQIYALNTANGEFALTARSQSLSKDLKGRCSITATNLKTAHQQTIWVDFIVKYDSTDPNNTISVEEFNVPEDERFQLKFSEDLYTCELQFNEHGKYTVKLAKQFEYSIEYNTNEDRSVMFNNNLDSDADIKFLNFVSSPTFDYANTFYIAHGGYRNLYEITGSNGELTRLSVPRSGDYFQIKNAKSFKNYVLSNKNLKSTSSSSSSGGNNTDYSDVTGLLSYVGYVEDEIGIKQSSGSSTEYYTVDSPKITIDGKSYTMATLDTYYDKTSVKLEAKLTFDKYGDVTRITITTPNGASSSQAASSSPQQPSTGNGQSIAGLITKETLEAKYKEIGLGTTIEIAIQANSYINTSELKSLAAENKNKLVKFVCKSGNAVTYQFIMNNAQIQKLNSDKLILGCDTAATAARTAVTSKYKAKFTAFKSNMTSTNSLANFAVKIDTAGLDKNNLKLYTYEESTGYVEVISLPYVWIDGAGYTHFTAPLGISYIITSDYLE